MRKVALFTVFAFALGVAGAPAAWARTCPKKYHQVRALVEKGGNYDTLKKAIECAEQGIQLHEQGRHDELVKTLNRCLKMLKGWCGLSPEALQGAPMWSPLFFGGRSISISIGNLLHGLDEVFS